MIAVIFGLIGYGAYRLGSPAILECVAHLLGRATTDASRLSFNYYLRGMSSLAEFVYLLAIAGAAAEGVAAERCAVDLGQSARGSPGRPRDPAPR